MGRTAQAVGVAEVRPLSPPWRPGLRGFWALIWPLSPKQHKGIQALLSCGTVQSAAVLCGVHPSTLRRWQHNPAFAQELETRTRELTAGAFRP